MADQGWYVVKTKAEAETLERKLYESWKSDVESRGHSVGIVNLWSDVIELEDGNWAVAEVTGADIRADRLSSVKSATEAKTGKALPKAEAKIVSKKGEK